MLTLKTPLIDEDLVYFQYSLNLQIYPIKCFDASYMHTCTCAAPTLLT